jgi:hypothetical protein
MQLLAWPSLAPSRSQKRSQLKPRTARHHHAEASPPAIHRAFASFHLLMLECLCGQPRTWAANLDQRIPVQHHSPYRNDVTTNSPRTNSWTVIKVDKIYRKRKRRKRRCTMTVAMEEREGSSNPLKMIRNQLQRHSLAMPSSFSSLLCTSDYTQ